MTSHSTSHERHSRPQLNNTPCSYSHQGNVHEFFKRTKPHVPRNVSDKIRECPRPEIPDFYLTKLRRSIYIFRLLFFTKRKQKMGKGGDLMSAITRIDDCLSRRNGHLFVEDCDAIDLVRRFGSPADATNIICTITYSPTRSTPYR
jgi:hypothetical protein